MPDLLTFWQRLPDTVPIYPYYYETEILSAIPLKDFKHWWEKQIGSDTRKKARRPEKRGVEIRVVPLDDAFVSGVMGVFNETPVRRGKPFWHYGKDFETIKQGLSRDLDRSKFIGAYDGGELVGFVKLVCAEGAICKSRADCFKARSPQEVREQRPNRKVGGVVLPESYSLFDLHEMAAWKSGGVSCAKWFPEGNRCHGTGFRLRRKERLRSSWDCIATFGATFLTGC